MATNLWLSFLIHFGWLFASNPNTLKLPDINSYLSLAAASLAFHLIGSVLTAQWFVSAFLAFQWCKLIQSFLFVSSVIFFHYFPEIALFPESQLQWSYVAIFLGVALQEGLWFAHVFPSLRIVRVLNLLFLYIMQSALETGLYLTLFLNQGAEVADLSDYFLVLVTFRVADCFHSSSKICPDFVSSTVLLILSRISLVAGLAYYLSIHVVLDQPVVTFFGSFLLLSLLYLAPEKDV